MDLKAVASLLMQILKHAAGMYMLVRSEVKSRDRKSGGWFSRGNYRFGLVPLQDSGETR